MAVGEPSARAARLVAPARGVASHVGTSASWTLSDADGALRWHRSPDELLGRPPAGAWDDHLRPIILAITQPERGSAAELTLPTRDGERILLVEAYPRTCDGAARDRHGVVLDVTDDRVVAREEHDARTRYDLLIELSPDAIVVHQDGIVRYANAAAWRGVGATAADEMVGEPLVRFVDPGSVATMLERLASLTDDQMATEPTEALLLRLDGTPVLGEAISVRTQWEGRAAFQVIVRDLTERLQAQSVLRYRASVLEHASDAIIGVDEECRVVTWNPAAESTYGWTEEQARGRVFSELVGDRGGVRSWASGPPDRSDVQHRRADGTELTIRMSVSALPGVPGQPGGWILVCEDVTLEREIEAERRRAVAELERYGALLAATLDATADAIVAMSLFEDVTTYNRAFTDLCALGAFEPEDLSTRRSDVFGMLVDPAGFATVTSELRAHPERESFDVLGLQDGRVFECRSRPQRLHGEVIGRVWSLRDVTAQVRGEEALAAARDEAEASRALLEATLDATSDGILTTDLEGRPNAFNRRFADLLGLTSEEGFLRLTADSPEVRSQFKDPDAFVARTRDILARPAEDSFDLLEFWDGRIFERRSHPQSLHDAIVGRVWTLRDATERLRAAARLRAAKEEAEAASRAKSDFLSRMSHELRTPLNAILGFAELAELDAESEEQAETVGRILRAARHLVALIDDILDIARLDVGRLQLDLEPVSVAEVVDESLALIERAAAERGIEMTVAVDDAVVRADARRLRQVLLNLLTNAVKYNREQGRVVVESSSGRDRIRIAVRDTGPGIAAEDVGRLFTPFERLEATKDVDGTGVGLALAKSFIQAMDGRIGVDSTPNEGTTFWFELPRAAL